MSNLPDPIPKSRPPQMAGGCLIAAGVLIGPVVGIFFGQTSLGLVVGLGIGIIAALVMALRGR